jgi:hypothetical protein
MRARLLLLSILFAAIGCGGLRLPAKSAALGALEAIDRPPPDAEIARKVGRLLEQYVDRALAAGPPPGVEELSASATRGAVKGFGEAASVEQMASGAARALTSGASQELATNMNDWVGPDAQGPLADAMAALAARSAGAAVQGATAALKNELATCEPGQGEPCLPDMARILSRSVARGASEGVGRGIDWVAVSLAFVLGLGSALGVGFLISALRDRRRIRV